jgi:PAS domain S-box-containing protein
VQAALENGGKHYLDELYDIGSHEYFKNKLFLKMTDEEKDFIRNSPAIPFGAEYANYPISFFNERYSEWQGIAFDVLEEITLLTGLDFEVANPPSTQFYELLEMLGDGRVHMVSELIHTPERDGLYIWPDNALMHDRSVLISKVTQPNTDMNKIYSASVGLSKGSAHTEFFLMWFPNHQNYTVYNSQKETFDALMNGEVDFVMNGYGTLLNLINYQELPDYKANILFNNSFIATFGINKEQTVLCSIVDKALDLIDTEIISERWRNRTYDYQLKLIQAQRPWIIGVGVLLSCVLVLVAVMLVKSHRAGKRLEFLVTERTLSLKEQAHKLALETAAFTTLFDSIPEHIFTKDLDCRYMHCNKFLLENFKISKEDIIGKDDIEGLKMPVDVAGKFIEEDKKAMRERETVVIEDYIPRFDGTTPLYEIIKMPLMVNGEVAGVVGISRNITARKEREKRTTEIYEYAKELSVSLSKITQSPAISGGDLKSTAFVIAKEGCDALKADNIGIWLMSEDGTHLESISYYSASTGEHIVQDNFDLSCRREYAGLLETERLIVMNNTVECELITDEAACLCAGLDAPIRIDGNLVGVICVEQNRCEKYDSKREWMMEEQNFASSLADMMALAISGFERRKARDEAEVANQSKSSFLANMSHEIRTPMNAILGITEILINNESLPPDIEEGLGKIYSSCNLLLGIINDILDFSKIEAGKLDINPNPYLTASLINDSAQLNLMRIESKTIEFEVSADKEIPAKLIGDELRIKQVLNNLLSNAFKYTESGKITLTVAFEPIPDTNKIKLILGVRDSGQGMSEEQLSKLFDEYARFNNESNLNVEGTGLGLAITQRLIGLMDGEIHVDSKPGVGSLFTVSFLQEVAEDSEPLGEDVAENLRFFRMDSSSHNKRGTITRELMPYGKVLVVDDVETNLYVAAGLLRPYKLQIDTASSGLAAIERVESGKEYDIVFMDHMMPEMDGIEATKKLREIGYTKPIVALTANAVAGQADIFLNNGFDDFVSKPIDIRQLNLILNKLIRDNYSGESVESKGDETEMQGTSKFTDRKIDGLDIGKGIDKFDKNEDVYLIIMRSYIASMQIIIDELTASINVNEQNITDYRRNVHSVKGASYDIFAEEVGDLAKNLENAAINADYDFISKNTEALTESLQKLVSDLNNMLDIIESENPKPRKDAPSAELLTKLHGACTTYEIDVAEEAMQELEGFSYDKDNDLVLWLRKNLNMMKFEEIVGRLGSPN